MLDVVEAEIREKNLHQKKKKKKEIPAVQLLPPVFMGHDLVHQAGDGDWGFWVQIPGISHLHRHLKPHTTLPHRHTRHYSVCATLVSMHTAELLLSLPEVRTCEGRVSQ